MNLNEYYQTSDIALSAAISLFIPLDSIDNSNPTRAIFIFKRDEGIDKIIENYWKNTLRVDPQAYFNKLKNLKTRLREY